MNPSDADRRVTIDITADADLDIEAAVARLLNERHGCQVIPLAGRDDDDTECGAPAVVARLRRMTCSHEDHLAWRYACITHAGGRAVCWHCRADIDIVIELPIGGTS